MRIKKENQVLTLMIIVLILFMMVIAVITYSRQNEKVNPEVTGQYNLMQQTAQYRTEVRRWRT